MYEKEGGFTLVDQCALAKEMHFLFETHITDGGADLADVIFQYYRRIVDIFAMITLV